MNIHKLAVVYVRVSTQYQVDNFSVQDQRGLTSLATRYGFAAVEVREEQGVSAETIIERMVMKKLLEDISKGLVGAIIVSSFTRLTRDMDDIDGRIIKKTCRDHDCVIITPEKLYDFMNEADDDLADLQFFFSKIQKRMNLKPMIRGEYTKAKNGGFVGLPLSFGYDYQWKEETTAKGTRYVADLVINEEEANVVRHIHDLFPNYLYRQIASCLNEQAAKGEMTYCPIKQAKLREKYGKPHREWRLDDIRLIIKNDRYVGRLQYAVNSKSSYLRGLDPVYTHREELRILPDAVYERNQRIAEDRQKISSRSKGSPHLFSGILRCPHCGDRMLGRRQQRNRNSGVVIEYTYQCNGYTKSGPSKCAGYLIPEEQVIRIVLPLMTELIQKNLRNHLKDSAKVSSLNVQLEGEIKAKLAQVTQEMKNLLEAVKHGALKMEQVKAENDELLATQHRLEKRLAHLADRTKLSKELSDILQAFDQNLDDIFGALMQNRLRFNTVMRLFFAELTIEVNRPGSAWKKGIKKGEVPEYQPRLPKYKLAPRFDKFVQESGIELPEVLKQAERQSPVYLSERNGSPFLAKGYDSLFSFLLCALDPLAN